MYNTLKIALAGAALAFTGSTAMAATLTLESATAHTYQHSGNSPCIISGQNCPQQPSGFDYTEYHNTGGMGGTTQASPDYMVSTLLGMFVNGFSVGVDINDTGTPQTLDYFAMLVDGMVVDSYTGSADNVPALANGNGYADYLLRGFTSLANYGADSLVSFQMRMSGMNDGPESFFLVANGEPPPPAPIPLPATGLLLLAGVGGLAAARRRKAA